MTSINEHLLCSKAIYLSALYLHILRSASIHGAEKKEIRKIPATALKYNISDVKQ